MNTVRTPPSIRGGVSARTACLFFGLFLCACGIVAFLESSLGLPPWDVLHQGLAEHTPLSFGAANIAVGLVVLALAAALGARIGFGTVANATAIGAFVILLGHVAWVDALSETGLAARIGLLVAGVACFGVGSAFYIGAAMGAGPRDSLMLVGSSRSGVRVGAVRATIEAGALLAGFLLGGTVGIGTVAFAALIGPTVEAAFWLLGRSRLADAEVASAPQWTGAD